MKSFRILFTGVGRRVELMQAFRQAANHLNVNLKLYGADMTGTAPALAFCDATRKICGMRDKKYIPELLEICKMDQINLIIPTIDTDFLLFSQNTEKLENIGTKVLISKPDKIAVCRDKNYIKIGIITDGRVSGQKKKLQALGLDKLVDDIIITDELGGIQFRKPCDIAFRIMQHRWGLPFEQMTYVGDNAEKDFQAPKQLGMRSLHLINTESLYSRVGFYAEKEISTIEDLRSILI